jgi:hypothetical protein
MAGKGVEVAVIATNREFFAPSTLKRRAAPVR